MLLKSIRFLSNVTALATCFTLSASVIPNLPEPVSSNATASTTILGKTYIASFGGIGVNKQQSDIHNKVWLYTVGDFNWQSAPALPSQQQLQGRLGASAVALNNSFYIFGGYGVKANGDIQNATDNYRFDPINRRYTRLNDIPVPVSNSPAVAYKNRYIYLISGSGQYGNVNVVQVFDNFTQRWSQATPFIGKPSSGLTAAILGNHVLACDGAIAVYEANKAPELQNIAACYLGEINPSNPNHINWQKIAHPSGVGHYRMASISSNINGKELILLIGGATEPHRYNSLTNALTQAKPSAKVWAYSVSEKRWFNAEDTHALMDLRSLIELNGSLYSIGGMEQNAQITEKVIKHEIKLQ